MLMLRITPILLCIGLLSAAGCAPEESTLTSTPAPATRAIKQTPKPTLKLPTLNKPELLPAERIVHLLYTSNVAGEAEPCG